MTDPGEVLHYRLAGSLAVTVAGPGGGVVHTVVHLVTELYCTVLYLWYILLLNSTL